ncbi:MAG: anti-sigma factor antagonist [Thermoleophilaceae bacterium]|jgi:anti-sigma B factor antagonist|nr:anti-sigma factor antagonist [Thermoleophilaceae bacterium]MEA2471181.1 anti-sigma factor antagonist [Thermoleophilaceae bacterium]
MSTLSLHTYQEPDRVRVAVSGELDLSSALVFEEELRRIEQQSDVPLLVLDLRSLKFMDSTGLRLILSAHARAIKNARKLAIVEGGAAVRRIFKITGVLERLNFVDGPPLESDLVQQP